MAVRLARPLEKPEQTKMVAGISETEKHSTRHCLNSTSDRETQTTRPTFHGWPFFHRCDVKTITHRIDSSTTDTGRKHVSSNSNTGRQPFWGWRALTSAVSATHGFGMAKATTQRLLVRKIPLGSGVQRIYLQLLTEDDSPIPNVAVLAVDRVEGEVEILCNEKGAAKRDFVVGGEMRFITFIVPGTGIEPVTIRLFPEKDEDKKEE